MLHGIKLKTIEKPEWTAIYHDPNPDKKGFGGKVIITMKDGSTITDQLAIANAHPNGARPFVREHYVQKFDTLTNELITSTERNRFIQLVENLENLTNEEVQHLNVVMDNEPVFESNKKGIF